MKASKNINHSQAVSPYPASFIDRFLTFLQRLPGPTWLTFLVLFLLQGILLHILAWMDGWIPSPFHYQSILLLYPIWLWFPLAIVTFLNKTSDGVLNSFSPLLPPGKEVLQNLKYTFTTMPNRGAIPSSAFWLLVFFLISILSFDSYANMGAGRLLTIVLVVSGAVSFGVGSVIYYHSLRQLGLVNRTVKMVKQFNLFNLSPVYAFSHLTAWTGISWVLMAGLTLLVFPVTLAPVVVAVFIVVQIGLAVTAFVLPLRSVNRKLVQEKRRLLAEHNQRLESTLALLHRGIDGKEMQDMAQLNNAITGMNTERAILDKIPTLPWRTETLTGFLSATVLPILLLLLQIVIRKWLGG